MTWQSKCMGFYPVVLLSVLAALSMHFLFAPSIGRLLMLLAGLYLLPVASYRLHNLIWPLTYGVSNLSEKKYSSWWGGHQIQIIFTVFPVLEKVLRLIPGLYSCWLRLWGSRVGNGVYWTPQVELCDRGTLIIGDGVVFGHKVECYGHVIKPKASELRLYTDQVIIGNGVFLGAGSRIGPGVKIEDGTFVPLLSIIFLNKNSGES